MTYEAAYKDYEKMLAALSHRARRRAEAAGIVLEFEDLFQEARQTFLRACETFDAQKGAKFSTYLWASVVNNLKRIESVSRSIQARTVSLDKQVGDDDGGTFHDILGCDQESVEDRLERLETETAHFHRLSQNAKRVILALDSPTPEIAQEVRRMQAFRQLCIDRSMAAATRQLDVTTICTLIGLSDREARKVKQEFKALMEEVYG
ncbi:MAG: hypothetical protein LPK02_07435 [Rhodobacterales bacterium]|nr:hypothetical protein [Rhodobacterales bacterium]